MVFAQDQVKVSIRAAFDIGGVQAEIQDTGFWLQMNISTGYVFTWAELVQGIAEFVRDQFVAHILPAHYSNSLVGLSVVTYHYDQGHTEVLDRGEAPFTGTGNTWAGTASNGLPSENTVVVSLYGYDPTGYATQRARKRGRMFTFTPSGDILYSDGRLNTAAQAAYLAQYGDFFDAIYAHDFSGGDLKVTATPIVVSVAGQTQIAVAFLRVGEVVDTQRRRRNKLAENYVNRELVP